MEERKATIDIQETKPVELLNETKEATEVGKFEDSEKLDWTRTQLYEILRIKKNLPSLPTHSPKDYIGQYAFYNNKLYVSIDGTWYNVGPNSFWATRGDRGSGDGAGSVTFTPGFEAKMIKVTATNGTDAVSSYGTSTGVGSDYAICTSSGGTNDKIIYIYSGSTKSSAAITSITSTQFTIEWTTNSVDTYYLIEAIG